MSGPHRVLAGSARWRPLPLLLAILAHGAALWLLLAARQSVRESAAQPVLVYMQPLSVSRTTTTPLASPARALKRSSATPAPPPPIIAPEPSAPSTAIQLPSPDWQIELQRSARNVVEEQAAAQKLRSLDSRPKVLQLPRESTEPKPGDVAILPNGDLLFTFAHGWTCLHSQPALDEAFSVWAKHRPAKCTKKGDGTDGGKIELQPRDYLREPLPDPPAAD